MSAPPFTVADLAAASWAALCAVLLLVPGESVKPRQTALHPLEDPVHAVLALVLAALVWRALARRRGRRAAAWPAAGLAGAYLLLLELLQEVVPGRGWEWSDAAFTLLGAAFAAVVARSRSDSAGDR